MGWWGTGLEKGSPEGWDRKGVGMWVPRNRLLGRNFNAHDFFSLVAGKQRRSASKTPFCYYKPDQSQTYPHQAHPLLFFIAPLPSRAHTHVLVSLKNKQMFWLGWKGEIFLLLYIYIKF